MKQMSNSSYYYWVIWFAITVNVKHYYCIKNTFDEIALTEFTGRLSKDLGHFWLGYIRMLGHL